MNRIVPLLFLIALLFSAGCLSAQTSISQPQSADLDKVRAGMKAAGFAPVRAASLTGTWEGYLKSYRQWLVRNFAVPMKAAIASEPWAEDAVALLLQSWFAEAP